MTNIRAILGGAAAVVPLTAFGASPFFSSISNDLPLIGIFYLPIAFVFAGFFTSALAITKPFSSIIKSIFLSAGCLVVFSLPAVLLLPSEQTGLGLAPGVHPIVVFVKNAVATVLVLLLMTPPAMFGVFLEQLLKRVTGKRMIWNYRTQNGLEIPVSSSKRHVGLGVFWVVFTVIGSIATLLLVSAGGLSILLWIATMFLGASLARSHLCTLTDISIIEGGNFAFYLRAFNDDELGPVQGSFLRKMRHMTKVLRAGSLDYGIVKQVKQTYPVIAIGRPNDRMQPDGALRLYVDNEHWQTLVADLASKCSLIILQAGQSQGLQWEIDLIGAVVAPERTIIFYPLELRRSASHMSRRELQYGVFKSRFERAFGKRFPIYLGDAYFQSLSNDNSREFVNRTFHEARRSDDDSNVVSSLAKARLFAPSGWRPAAEWGMFGLWIFLLIIVCHALAFPAGK